MKRLTLVLLVVLVGLSFQGCPTLGTPSKTPAISATASTNVVRYAEKALAESRLTIETFLQLEDNHRDFVRKNVPAVHKGAEYLRANYIDKILAAQRVKNTFKKNMNAQNEADLMTAVQVVVQLAGEASAYTKTLNESTP